MSFSIYITSSFEKDIKGLAKKYPSVKKDIKTLLDVLITEPFKGQALGRDCYKIRMAITSKGKGKSGGARVITCVKVVRNSIFLLKVYDKSEKESVGDNELTMLLEDVGLL